MDEGRLIIVTAPSGAGKTTIVHYLAETVPNLAFSVSATTRKKREKETEGIDYYFLSHEEFQQKITGGELLEWQEVYPGQFYGTLQSEVARLWKDGKNIIFDVDVNGAMNLKAMYPRHTLSIFIQPPSLEVLIERLQKRATESPDALATRIERVRYEMTCAEKFDITIVNDQLPVAEQEAYNAVTKFLSAPL